MREEVAEPAGGSAAAGIADLMVEPIWSGSEEVEGPVKAADELGGLPCETWSGRVGGAAEVKVGAVRKDRTVFVVVTVGPYGDRESNQVRRGFEVLG